MGVDRRQVVLARQRKGKTPEEITAGSILRELFFNEGATRWFVVGVKLDSPPTFGPPQEIPRGMARGYGALKAILEVLAEEEPLEPMVQFRDQDDDEDFVPRPGALGEEPIGGGRPQPTV